MVGDKMDACLFGSRDLAQNNLAECTLAPSQGSNGQRGKLLPAQHLLPLLVRATSPLSQLAGVSAGPRLGHPLRHSKEFRGRRVTQGQRRRLAPGLSGDKLSWLRLLGEEHVSTGWVGGVGPESRWRQSGPGDII